MGIIDSDRGPTIENALDPLLQGDCVHDPHDSYPGAYLRYMPYTTVWIEYAGADEPKRVVFDGQDPVAEADEYLTTHGILRSGTLLDAYFRWVFPGYAFDCVVEDWMAPDSPRMRQAFTINDLVNVSYRYNKGQAFPMDANEKLDGELQRVHKRAGMGPTERYSFEKFAVSFKFGASLTSDPMTGGQIVAWPTPPPLTAADFDFFVTADTGNVSDGSSVLECGLPLDPYLPEVSAPLFVVQMEDNAVASYPTIPAARQDLAGQYGSVAAAPVCRVAWMSQEQLNMLIQGTP